MRVAGVDGTKGGWVAILLEDGRFAGDEELPLETDFGELGPLDAIAVDVPIGFGPREADRAARRYLRGAAATVFTTPPRETLERPYRPGLAVSAQAHALGPRVLWMTRLAARSSDYLYWLLRTPQYREYCRTRATGTTNLGLARDDFLSFPVPEPTPVRRRVVELLGALDDKIELNRRMNETLTSLGRHLYAQTIETAAPRSLAELALVNARKRSADFDADEIEYLDISSVREGDFEASAPVPIDAAPSRAQRLVADGDTIWSCVRPNRKSYAFMDATPENRVVSTGFAVLTPCAVPPAFLHFAVTTDEFVDYLTANADGSAYPAVKPDHFLRAEIPVPARSALEAFEAAARPLLGRMAHNQRESRTLAELRDTLLPKLISGELRVREVEKAL